MEEYFSNVYNTFKYVRSEPQLRNAVLLDTMKCTAIAMTCLCVWQFTQGRCHYFKYLGQTFKGIALGIGYSFYYTGDKVTKFRVDRIYQSQEKTRQGSIYSL